MLALNDRQLQIVMTAAGSLPVEKRGLLLQRLDARLRLQGLRHPADVDVERALDLCLYGLIARKH